MNQDAIYLDWNIFVSIKNKEFDNQKISSFIDSKNFYYPFSSSHIQEIDNITYENEDIRKKLIIEYLDFLSTISRDLYLYHDLNKESVYYLKEKPHEVLDTINAVPFAKSLIKSLLNFISFDQRKRIREELNIDPKRINNYAPDEVVSQIDRIIKSKSQSFGFFELLNMSFNSFANKQGFGLHNYIAAIFELLDMIGYWRDEEKENSNYARSWDASHTFFASHTKYFISDDRRTRNKAKVAYSLFKIKTKVVSSEEALPILNQ